MRGGTSVLHTHTDQCRMWLLQCVLEIVIWGTIIIIIVICIFIIILRVRPTCLAGVVKMQEGEEERGARRITYFLVY